MIEVNGLYKSYGTNMAVKNVSFTINKGEIVGFLGPNGAGKSTIMNILTGYISLSRGRVQIDGFDILESPENAKKRIGYLPEIPPLYVEMTVREYLMFIYDLKKVKFPKEPHIEEVMSLVGLLDVSSRLIKNLSKGYRQRVGLAAALIGNPDVIVLDEPTVGLDPKQIIEIRNLISRLGENHTIILSSHILSEIQAVCDRVIIINKGEIVADDLLDNLSSNLSKNSKLSLKVKGDAEKIFQSLSDIEQAEEISVSATEQDGIFEFIIKPQENCDITEIVSKTVTENGGIILSYLTDNATLEQIFLRLTTEQIEEQFDEMEEEENETVEETETPEETEGEKEDNNESDI